MTSRSHFHAQVISTGPLEGVSQHVGWASDGSGVGPHLLLMRDEDSGLCIVSGDDTTYATCYGGLMSSIVGPTETRIELTADAAAQLGIDSTVVISYDESIADPDYLRAQLDLTLG